jgi:streptogrisin C
MWKNGTWTKVAAAESESADETLVYDAPAGYFAWMVKAYSGSGAYTLYLRHP